MDEKPIANRQPAERVEGCWLILAYPENPTIRLDARLLDRALGSDSNLILSVGELNMGLQITGGRHVARDIADALARFIRHAPITCEEGLEDARRRRAALDNKSISLPAVLFFGDAPVRVSPQEVRIGEFSAPTADVIDLAQQEALLALPGGFMWAIMPMLLVADQLRDEDVEALDRRIAEYAPSNEAADPTNGKPR